MSVPKSQLNLGPVQKALKSLEKALHQSKNEFTRDAVIQRFEYTYELTWKFLKHYFVSINNKEIFIVKDLFREAAQQGLIDHAEEWFEFQKARNLTSHTYHEETAEETYMIAKNFASAAKILLQRLNEKLNAINT